MYIYTYMTGTGVHVAGRPEAKAGVVPGPRKTKSSDSTEVCSSVRPLNVPTKALVISIKSSSGMTAASGVCRHARRNYNFTALQR